MKTKTPAHLREGRRDIIVAALLALGAAFENSRGQGRAHRAWLAAVPIVIVNYVAFRAQLRFWQDHLGRSDALLVSVAVEAIAIYLAWQAHLAMLADDSALRLRLAAYGVALLIGSLNYSHYMHPGWRPTVAAVTFGGMSAISPWLWSIHSRRGSRDRLKLLGRIEDHAVRLGATRWFWHAYRCCRVMFKATWINENRPAEAIKLIEKPAVPAEPAGEVQVTASQTPPPVTRIREPRPAGRAARVPGLVAARSAVEQEMIQEMIQSGQPLPGRNELSRDPKLIRLGSDATRKRAAARILTGVTAARNGHVRVNGS